MEQESSGSVIVMPDFETFETEPTLHERFEAVVADIDEVYDSMDPESKADIALQPTAKIAGNADIGGTMDHWRLQ